MREELCNRLDRHRARLIKELNITTTFLASLLSKQVISSENKATIEVSYFLYFLFILKYSSSRLYITINHIRSSQ